LAGALKAVFHRSRQLILRGHRLLHGSKPGLGHGVERMPLSGVLGERFRELAFHRLGEA